MRTNRGMPAAWTQMHVSSAPMSTTASSPASWLSRFMPSKEPTERTMAKGIRSMPIGESFAACAHWMIWSTIAFWAATRSSRTIWRPSCSNSSRISKSSTASSTGIGTCSCTWKGRDSLNSFSGSHGRRDLADHHSLVAHAEDDLALLELADAPQLAQGVGHGLGFADLSARHGSRRERHLSDSHERGRRALQLGGTNRRCTDVDTNSYACHVSFLRLPGPRP